ncbi:ABC transporter substrate-binding protein [Paenibacillus endoradicis]|uniref:ABC transporter substrate-binding protein n=1 Tax=Paenibacillus endoradicis TaxID=2972487 RepID=UPI002158A3AB|nr:ABC transporter substrate-binding protein [Paenibacillus endoradicis]MCR8657511.1 ABC transporter substrate-binding protein [Paenibacillus endoradicis]
MKGFNVKRLSFVVIVGILSVLLTACGSNNEANQPATVTPVTTSELNKEEVIREPFVVTDQVGNEVSIPGSVDKVYAPGLEDYLVTLGVTPVAQWSTGTSPQQYLQDALSGVQEISFANGVPSPETVVDLEPELILFPTAFYAQNGVHENYSQIASTYVFENALGNVVEATETIAQLLGLEEKATEAISAYNTKLESTKAQLASITAGKKAIYINANARAIFLVGNFHYGGYVLSELGFAQSALVEGQSSANISLEMISDLEADYIFINDNDGLGDAFLSEIKNSPLWSALPAVQSGQVFEVKGDHWRSSGLIAYEKTMDDIVEFLQP